MKTKHLLASVAMGCAVADLVGCASLDHQRFNYSLDEKNLERDEAPSATGLSQPVVLDESAFQNLDFDTNGAVGLDEWQRSDTNAGRRENFSTLGENDDRQINVTDLLTQAPKHSKLYPVFGDAEQTNNNRSFWDQQELQSQGLQLFSIPF